MLTTLIIVAAVAILIILLATASYKVCPADRVMVLTLPWLKPRDSCELGLLALGR